MLLRRLEDCPEFVAGDRTVLRELLHPGKQAARVGYSVAHGFVPVGERSTRHRLTASEVYYFIAGRGLFHLDQESAVVERGTLLCVPPGAVQSVENTSEEPLEFLCLVEPAWTPASETVLE